MGQNDDSSMTGLDPYLSMARLKERGWSAAMVTRFLGEADALKANPFYRQAAPMRLYDMARVVAAEGSDAFKQARIKAAVRSQQARARAENQTQDLVERLAGSVTLRTISQDRLRRRAIDHKRRLDQARGYYDEDPAEAPEHHIQRWMVNFARHELSNYDSVRDRYAGQVGVHVAAERVREIVLDRIAQAWPELTEACRLAQRSEE